MVIMLAMVDRPEHKFNVDKADGVSRRHNQQHMKLYRNQFLNRMISTYLFSLVVVGILLLVVDKAPWLTDFSLALKRTIIGTLPASMSATVTDAIT
jgi:uncharacterized membrane protein